MTDKSNTPRTDEFNYDFYKQNYSGGQYSEVADAIFSKSNDKYRKAKDDYVLKMPSKTALKQTFVKKDGKLSVVMSQELDYIIEECKMHRKLAEEAKTTPLLKNFDPVAPIGEDGKREFRWANIPSIIDKEIARQYFDGYGYEVLRHFKPELAKYYKVLQTNYPQFITYPGGILPLPANTPMPKQTAP